MTLHNGKAVCEAMLSQIFTKTQAVCFIHTQMYFLRADALREVFQHRFDELIGLFLLRKKVVPVILQAIAFRPAQEST